MLSKLNDRLQSRLSRQGGSARAPLIVLLTSDDGARSFALGLRWRAVVTSRSKSHDLMQEAAKEQASHVAMAPFLMGTGNLLSPPKDKSVSFFAAAMVAAQNTQQSDALFALKLPDGRVWLARISDAHPSGQEEILSELEAAQRIHSLRLIDVGLQVWTDIEGIAKASPYSFNDLMVLPPPATARMHQVHVQSFLHRMPTSARWIGGLVIVGLLGMQGMDWWQNTQRIEIQQRLASQQTARVDEIRQAWQGQIAANLATRAAQVDLAPLRASIDKLPVILQGWRLQTAKCASDYKAQAKTWHCTAVYNTPDIQLGGKFDPNKQLAAPSGFEIDYLPTKEIHLRWSIQTPATALTQSNLPDRASHLIGTASLLQMNLQGLHAAPEIKFSPIKLLQPQLADGTTAPMPSDLQLPQQAQINLKAPLSTADAVVPRISADWTALTLTPILPNAGTFTGAQFGLDIEWMGILHAKP